jgi:hypothetical protein
MGCGCRVSRADDGDGPSIIGATRDDDIPRRLGNDGLSGDQGKAPGTFRLAVVRGTISCSAAMTAMAG